MVTWGSLDNGAIDGLAINHNLLYAALLAVGILDGNIECSIAQYAVYGVRCSPSV